MSEPESNSADDQKETVCLDQTVQDYSGIERRLDKLIIEVQECQAEKQFYIKENAFLKDSMRRIFGL